MEGFLLVHPQHIVPQRRSRPRIDVRSDGEAIAGVEHDAHRLGRGWDDEALRGLDARRRAGCEPCVRDRVLPSLLLLMQRDVDRELPKLLVWVCVELDAFRRSRGASNTACMFGTGDDALGTLSYLEDRQVLARFGDYEHTAVPDRLGAVRVC